MINLLQNNIDRLGHYQVGSEKFTLKSLAMQKSMRTGLKVNFIYNDDLFNQYDWTQEPEPNINIHEFYRRRAQQIRDNYDYIVLQYSGGADSQCIFDTFMNNDILLDEVVNFNSYEKTQRLEGTAHNADYVYNVKPVLEDMVKKYGTHRTRISIIDEIDMTTKVWREYKNRDYYELLFNSGSFPSVWMMRGIWIKHVPHIWNKLLEGKRVCVILGADKTTLSVVNNKFCTNFSDILCCDSTNLLMLDVDLRGHNFIELFFHTPAHPEIPIKQAHLLKRFVESQITDENFEDTGYYRLTGHRSAVTCNSKQFAGNLKYQQYHNIVYPGIKSNITTPKPRYFGTRNMDCWWVNEMSPDDNKIWRLSLPKYYATFKSMIEKNGTDLTTVPLTWTKPYFLEK